MKNDKIQSYMNTIRNTLFLGIICAVTTVFSTAHEFEFNKIYPKKSVKTQVRKEIVTFFSEYLSGKTTTFDAGKSLKLSEVEQYRDAVWQLWKEANASFEEEKLIALDTLLSNSSGCWKLPENLEPNAVMPYYWGMKGAVETGAELPLFLYLHGSGPKEREWSTGLKICRNFDDAPSVYFIPQIPNEGDYYRWWQKAKQFVWEKLLRQALLLGEIDPNRVYVFGISEGGYGSQRLASFYADYWAAAGPMAGGEPLKNAPAENCSNIAFSLRTGDKDTGFYRNTLTGYALEAFDSLAHQRPGHFIHKIELIPGMGHSIDYRPTTPWLKQYVRNPYPRYVSWENFEMDGIYRTGFYNLYVKERSDEEGKSRTYYEMNISGNDISLKVNEVVYEVIEKDPRWGIEMKFAKKYVQAHKGKVIIYLCDKLVDLNEKVTLTVNGKKVFEGKMKADLKNIVNSCAAFFDPLRLYPASIEVELD